MVVLVVAAVTAVLVTTGVPGKIVGLVDAGVCRVGQAGDCASPTSGGTPPRTPAGQPTQAPTPAATQPGGQVDPDSPEGLQRQINDAERAARDADREADDLSGKLDLGDLAKDFGLEASGVADAKRCFTEGDWEGCGWTALTVIPGVGWLARGGKAAKAGQKLKKLKKLKAAYDRYKRLAEAARKRAAAAREKARELREKLAKLNPCGKKRNSFVAGTPVLLGGGRHRPIEDVDIGDLVWAADPVTGRAGPRAVTDVIVGERRRVMMRLTVDTDGPAGDRTATIVSTDGHPFWTPAPGAWRSAPGTWTDARDLAAGDRLTTAAGAAVTLVRSSSYLSTQPLYDLTVAGLHTYFVGGRRR